VGTGKPRQIFGKSNKYVGQRLIEGGPSIVFAVFVAYGAATDYTFKNEFQVGVGLSRSRRRHLR
jgi:hypothetical protein